MKILLSHLIAIATTALVCLGKTSIAAAMIVAPVFTGFGIAAILILVVAGIVSLAVAALEDESRKQRIVKPENIITTPPPDLRQALTNIDLDSEPGPKRYDEETGGIEDAL